MKRGSLLFVLLSVIYINPVYSAAGDQYLLPKFGVMVFGLDNNDVDPLISGGVMWGFGLSDNVSFEAEFNFGSEGGEYKTVTTNQNTMMTVTGEYQVSTVAGYLVHRYPMGGTSYFKTKVGFLHEQVDFSAVTETSGSTFKTTKFNKTNGTGIAGGIGFGSAIGERLTLELEVTLIDKDIAFYSLGTHYRF